jgi:hypothetical protein
VEARQLGLVLAIVGAGAACGDRNCEVQPLAHEFLGDATLGANCGYADVPGPNGSLYFKVKQCLLDSAAARLTFIGGYNIYESQYNSRHEYAAVLDAEGNYEVAAFHQHEAYDPATEPTLILRCTDLVASAPPPSSDTGYYHDGILCVNATSETCTP